MGRPGRDPYEYSSGVEVECIKTTADALLIKDEDEEFWIPKSVVHDDSEVYELGGKGTLVVFEWFAEKEGWD